MERVLIREFKDSDYHELINLWDRAKLPYKPEGRDSCNNIRYQSKLKNTFYLVAEVRGRIIGSVLATHDGRKGWINRLAVDPEFQGRGIAKMLVEEAEKWFFENGIEIFACLIEEWNQRSMNFFKKMGYKKHTDIFYLTKRKNSDV